MDNIPENKNGIKENKDTEKTELLNDTDKSTAKKKSKWDVILCIILSVLILMSVGVIYYKRTMMNVIVDGTSMVPTLNDGDMLVAKKEGEVKRGDIVIIEIKTLGETNSTKLLVKRVIGIGGDKVKIENGKVYLQTKKDDDFILLNEDYIKEDINPSHSTKTWDVKEGEIFFLGDNRGVSLDSRSYGTVKESSIVGTVQKWSINKSGFMYVLNEIITWPNKVFSSCQNNSIGE